MLNEWLTYCKAMNHIDQTLTNYKLKVEKFIYWWEHHYSQSLGSNVNEVSTKHIREFIAYLREPNAARWGEPMPHHRNHKKPSASWGASIIGTKTPAKTSMLISDADKTYRIIIKIELTTLITFCSPRVSVIHRILYLL